MIAFPTLLWRPVLHVLRYSDPVVRPLSAYKLQQCLIFIRQPWPTTVGSRRQVLPVRDLQPIVFRGDVGVSFGRRATKIHVRGLLRIWLTSKNTLRSRSHYTRLIIILRCRSYTKHTIPSCKSCCLPSSLQHDVFVDLSRRIGTSQFPRRDVSRIYLVVVFSPCLRRRSSEAVKAIFVATIAHLRTIALFFGLFALQAHTLLLGDFFLSLLVSA